MSNRFAFSYLTLSFLLLFVNATHAQHPHPITHCEHSEFTETCPPEQVMPFYQKLAAASEYIQIEQIGAGDAGRPIHSVVVSKKQMFSPEKIADEAVFFILNGIHAGESCGIDATQIFLRDLLQQFENSNAFKNVIVVAIPVYNTAGHHNFSAYNRVNQNGPKQMGFRASGRYLNLNRDFSKADAENTHAFYRLYQKWQPHLFIDTHASDGADYQHAITYILNDNESTSPALRTFINSTFKPAFMHYLQKDGHHPIPYVMAKSRAKLSSGILGFYTTPRYSSGYASLFQSIAMISEMHMLKDYKTRVQATIAVLNAFATFADTHASELHEIRKRAISEMLTERETTVKWLRTNKADTIDFQGYNSSMRASKTSGSEYVHFNRDTPVSMRLPYFNHFASKKSVDIPDFYIVPQQWREIIERLKMNGVKMQSLPQDTVLVAERYRFENVIWFDTPYEGRMRVKSFDSQIMQDTINCRSGDWLIPTNQLARRYLVELLEPEAVDSFLRWGFFNAIFQQKEYFEPYLFEPTAAQILQNNPGLAQKFNAKIAADSTFARNPYARLQYIYHHSPYAEKGHNLYPIARIMH